MLAYVPLRVEADDARQPWGTIALFAANVLVALLVGCWEPFFGLFKGIGLGNPNDLLLPFDRFAPWTWITSAFVHADIAHLAFNMAFLLAFGMLVERMLGTARFVIAYLAVALLSGAAGQALAWGEAGSSGGASGCLFGLMVMAFAWAPQRRILMGYWVWRHVGTVWLPVSTIAAWFIGLNVVGAFLSGFTMSSFLLHALGAGAGLLVAVCAMRASWVDTGGEDWLSLRRAEAERVEKLPQKGAPWAGISVPQYTAQDHLESFAAFMIPVVAGLFVATGIGTILLHTGKDLVTSLPKALLLEAVGVGIFLWWKSR